MNSLPMSCCVISPYTASTIDGGNIAPSVPPAAITPVAERLRIVVNRRISGYATVENVAAVATDDPLIAANPAQAAIVAMPRPPRQWPTNRLAAWNSSRLMPERETNAPISRNIGITPNV